jgi:3-hydroxyacyl-CoA dehydrogenase
MMVLMLAQDQDWDEIDFLVRNFQTVNMSLKHAEKPVVVAPFGLTLGGGCEITLHASKVQAAAETYIGQVEVGVGVIPAGGGTKEMTLRTLKNIKGIKDADPLPFVQKLFETLGMAKVATSAMEAKKFGFLRETDLISMNSEQVIGDAKKTALAMVMQGYKKPLNQEKIMAFGESVLSPILIALDQMHEAGYITDYDRVIGEKLAYIITGGAITQPKIMDEQYFLDLEREAFLSLCGDKRTQARMAHMLKKGKPLRN